jgi:hypothetical protein
MNRARYARNRLRFLMNPRLEMESSHRQRPMIVGKVPLQNRRIKTRSCVLVNAEGSTKHPPVVAMRLGVHEDDAFDRRRGELH